MQVPSPENQVPDTDNLRGRSLNGPSEDTYHARMGCLRASQGSMDIIGIRQLLAVVHHGLARASIPPDHLNQERNQFLMVPESRYRLSTTPGGLHLRASLHVFQPQEAHHRREKRVSLRLRRSTVPTRR